MSCWTSRALPSAGRLFCARSALFYQVANGGTDIVALDLFAAFAARFLFSLLEHEFNQHAAIFAPAGVLILAQQVQRQRAIDLLAAKEWHRKAGAGAKHRAAGRDQAAHQ